MKYHRKELRYKNGYTPKIQYWSSLLTDTEDVGDRIYILKKIKYFTSKETERTNKKLSSCQS